jgi:PKD repeat protein
VNAIVEKVLIGAVCAGAGAALVGCGGINSGIAPVTEAPLFSVAAGTYTSVQTVAITDSTPGATIYYTTNGTAPTTLSTVYSGALAVSNPETLEAIAVAGGYMASAAASAAYVINLPPVANAGGPYTSVAGGALSFNGSGSSSPQGKALTYAWNFGDNTTGTGVSPTHTYSSAGTYAVSLTVTDTSGLTGTTSGSVIILPVGAALTGSVYSGVQPVAGAHVYVFAANTTGFGGSGIAATGSNASVSLENASLSGASDGVGAYVTTDANGAFSLSGDYGCRAGQQLYLYVRGGNAGAGTNTAIGMMAVLGSCSSTSAPAVYAKVNEESTVAAAYSMAGFATDATHVSSSGSGLAKTGVANALANAANLVTLATSTALTTTPAGNGTVPQAEINTLANILADCSGVGSGCSALFGLATADGTATGAQATETATAAINIAHHPGIHMGALYALLPTPLRFTPVLGAAPNDWTVALGFTGGGALYPWFVAIDGSGNVWIANYCGNTIVCRVSEFSPSGAPLSPAAGYTGGGMSQFMSGIAIDLLGDAWIVTNMATGPITELSPSGTILSGPAGITGGGIAYPYGVAINGSGNVWVTNTGGLCGPNAAGYSNAGNVSELSSSGTPISGNGFACTYFYSPSGIAIDADSNVWITNQMGNTITKLNSSGSPVSPFVGYAGGGLKFPTSIAIDAGGNAWIGNFGGTSISELSSTGQAVSPSAGFTGGGLSQPQGLAVDGAGNVWVASFLSLGPTGSGEIATFSSSGAAISPSTGYRVSGLLDPGSIAIDSSGNVWAPDVLRQSVWEFVGAAAPVVTPLVAGVKNRTLGTRP